MKTCVIIDDEANAREVLQKVINRYFKKELRVKAVSSSVDAGAEAIKKHRPDIVFLDVEMPQKNGFELYKYFDELSLTVIFTTAYSQYAITALKHAAVDYLLKPVTGEALAEALKRAEKRTSENTVSGNNGLNPPVSNAGKVALPVNNSYVFENANNILYCKSEINYTKIYFYDKAPVLVTKTLKTFETILPEKTFFRIHRSYIINLNCIKYLSKDKKITLENGDILPVSKEKIKELIERIKNTG